MENFTDIVLDHDQLVKLEAMIISAKIMMSRTLIMDALEMKGSKEVDIFKTQKTYRKACAKWHGAIACSKKELFYTRERIRLACAEGGEKEQNRLLSILEGAIDSDDIDGQMLVVRRLALLILK